MKLIKIKTSDASPVDEIMKAVSYLKRCEDYRPIEFAKSLERQVGDIKVAIKKKSKYLDKMFEVFYSSISNFIKSTNIDKEISAILWKTSEAIEKWQDEVRILKRDW